jgi:hypothetical protein
MYWRLYEPPSGVRGPLVRAQQIIIFNRTPLFSTRPVAGVASPRVINVCSALNASCPDQEPSAACLEVRFLAPGSTWAPEGPSDCGCVCEPQAGRG